LTSTLTNEIARRLTFAIISHPNAGKTTHLDREILAVWRGDPIGERGIPVSSAVMSFERRGSRRRQQDFPGLSGAMVD
jgi:peptide subunit release factor RF-3